MLVDLLELYCSRNDPISLHWVGRCVSIWWQFPMAALTYCGNLVCECYSAGYMD